MLSILSILEYIPIGLKNDPTRFTILDDQNIVDNKTGVGFHLYDDYFTITYGDEIIARNSDFLPKEKEAVGVIKNTIADPEKELQRKQEYPELIRKKRETFALLYQNPKPIEAISPVEEADTEIYKG